MKLIDRAIYSQTVFKKNYFSLKYELIIIERIEFIYR